MTENNKNGFTNGLTYLLIGGGIGATLALLFAPKSGSELRRNISDVTRQGYDATIEKANELKVQSADMIGTVKEKATAAYDFASAKINAGTEAIADAVSTTSESIADNIENTGKEFASAARQERQGGSGRRGVSIV